MIEQIIFYIFSASLLGSAVMVITVRNTVLAAFFLILSFFSSAVIWLLLEAEFLSITLVLIYVGAVMVLFMFVVMMLDIDLSVLRAGFARYLYTGLSVAVLMALCMFFVVSSADFHLADDVPRRHDADYSNTYELGLALYTDHLYPFEIAGAILLVAIIAAIALTVRESHTRKAQQPESQANVKSSDRLRIIKMNAEKGDTDGGSG